MGFHGRSLRTSGSTGPIHNPKTAAIVSAACLCFALQASATSLIRLDYVGGSTAQAGTGGSGVAANVSDLLSFDINVDVDSGGLAALSVDMRFESNTDLTLSSATWGTGTVFTSFAPIALADLLTPFDPMLPNTPPTQTIISNFGWVPNESSSFGPFFTSTNVFLGTVVFHVRTPESSGVTLAQINYNTTVAVDANLSLVTPDFSPTFTVNPVPEPGVAALMAFGLLGLAVAGRLPK